MPCTSQALELIRNGKAQSVIVIGAKAHPYIRDAARELQKHLRLLTGAELPILSDKNILHNKTAICVGESLITEKAGYKKTRFPKGTSAYEIVVRGRNVILNGPVSFYKRTPSSWEKSFHAQGQSNVLSSLQRSLTDDNGVMHSVSAFLEMLGVRFYAPGKKGTFYPRKKDVVLKETHIVKQAAFPVREYHFSSGTKLDGETLSFLKMLKCGSARYRVGILPLSDVMRQNPKLPRAKERSGKEIISLDGYGVPLYAHKGFRKACVERLRRIFDADKSLEAVQIIYPSARGGYDHNEVQNYTVTTVFPTLYSTCGIDVDFHKALALELAKTHPGKKILFQRYFDPRRVEKRIIKGVPANLQGSWGAVSVHTYASGKKYMKDLSALTGAFGKSKGFQKEFWNEFDFREIPRQGFFFLKGLQEVRRMQKDHLYGISMALPYDRKAKTFSGKELFSLVLYVNSKLLWKPDLDLERLLDEYFSLYYGPAKDAMRNFYSYGENVYSRQGTRSVAERNSCLQKEDVDVFFELLQQAKNKVSPKSIYYKRIVSLEKELLWMKSIFKEIIPGMRPLDAEIFAWDTPCDGDLSKYKKFYPLTYGPLQGNMRTEFAVAALENRRTFMLAVRCYEPEMKKLDRKKSQDDSLLILQKDHIRILIRNARSGPFELAVSADGAVLDRVFDPGYFSGDCASWNSAVHRGIVRYYKDRWEVEIPFGHIGLFPDWNPAWGFRVERVRTLNGQRLTSSNCRGKPLDMGHWASLTLQKKDSKGRDMVRRDGIHLPVKGVPDGVVYCIRKAKKNVPFSAAAWNDPETWGSVPEARLGNELFFYGRSNKAGYRPEPSFKMMYDDKYLYVFYKVKDRYVRGVFKKDQQMVCLDSCMELFIMPNGKGCYFNFEANCLGTLLLYRMGPQTKRIPLEELKKIRRFHSMPRTMFGEKVGDTVWYLGLQIPLDFFVRYADVTLPLKGQVWTGNVFKCADRSSHPCWMAWRNTVTFHSVEGFGKFIFE